MAMTIEQIKEVRSGSNNEIHRLMEAVGNHNILGHLVGNFDFEPYISEYGYDENERCLYITICTHFVNETLTNGLKTFAKFIKAAAALEDVYVEVFLYNFECTA